MERNPVVLRNKGVPVELYKVRQDGQGRWELDFDGDGEPPTETAWLRFTANEMVEIEEKFNGVSFVVDEVVTEAVEETDAEGNVQRVRRPTGEVRQVLRTYNGLEGFEKAGLYKPISTNRDAMAIVLHRSPEQVGAAMIPDKAPEYQVALGAAWSMANGTPAETVGKALEAGRVAMKRETEAARAKAEEMLDKAIEELTAPADGTPGPTSSPDGSESPKPEDSGEVSTSSGD